MSSLLSVKMSRFDGSPWGFRLQGGKDFAQPLVIQKVAGGSLAEKAGLQAGDAVIRVNSVEVFNLRHKEAQDTIVRAGNSFELTVQRGGGTWKPQVTSVGTLNKPNASAPISNVQPVTKTSLAARKTEAVPIGSGHNLSAKPFGTIPQVNGTEPTVKAIVNKQYNTPVGMYSEETIAETLSAQAEVLAGGVLGVNFKKNERNYDAAKSEVFKMLQEIDKEPHEPEPGSSKENGTSHLGVQTCPKPYTPPRVDSPDSGKSNHSSGSSSKTNYVQSQTFLRLQAALDENEDAEVNAVSRGTGVYPLAGLRHVSAPETKAPSSDQPSSPYAVPKTSLPPGQNICADCERLIVGVFVRIKDKNLHVECFKCATCGTSLKNVGYYNINNKLYCDIHAKLVARHHPPAPNLEPVTVPPGGKVPAGAISAAIAHSMASPGGPGTPTPLATAPLSPQPGTMAPLPFHPSLPPVEQSETDCRSDNPKVNGQDHFEVNKVSLKCHETRKNAPENDTSEENRQNLPETDISKVPSEALPENSLSNDISKGLPDHNLSKEYQAPRVGTSHVHAPRSIIQSPAASAPKPFSPVSAPAPSTSVSRPTSGYYSTLKPSTQGYRAAPAPAPSHVSAQAPEPSQVPAPAPNRVIWPPVRSEEEEKGAATACPIYHPPDARPQEGAPPASAAPLPTPSLPTLPTLPTFPKPVAAPSRPAPPPAASHPTVPPSTTPSGPSGAPKGGAFAGSTAPRRGRGILNPQAGPGVRVPLCGQCGNQIRGPFITALGKTWCPDHFVCVKDNCRRHLQDIGFVEEQGQLYCEYCFEKYLAPACNKCNNKIKGDCLNAIGQHFHPECFACAYCGKLFGNNPFFLEDGLPYCEADWNELFTTKCFACGFPIEAGDRWVEALNNNYHSQCFNCSMCKKNLEGQSFYAKSGRPFCKNHAR